MKSTNRILIAGMLALTTGCGSGSGSTASSLTGIGAGGRTGGGATGGPTPLLKYTDHDTNQVLDVRESRVMAQNSGVSALDDDDTAPADQPAPADPTTTLMSGAYEIHLDATVAGGGGSVVNGQVVGGVNSVTYITVQFASWGDLDWTSVANYYRFTIQTDETGNNTLAVSQGAQTGPDGSSETVIHQMSNPGQSLTLQVTRDANNTYFNYSSDGGTTWTTFYTIALSDFDSGDALLQADTYQSSAPANCSYNGTALPCYDNDPSYTAPADGSGS